MINKVHIITVLFALAGFAGHSYAKEVCPQEYIDLVTTSSMSSFPPAVKNYNEMFFPDQADVILVGDSHIGHLSEDAISKYENTKHILKLYGAGDAPQNTLWRLKDDRLIARKYKPKYVVFMLGTNVSGYPKCAIIEGIKQVLDTARMLWPEAKFVYVPLLPRGVYFDDNDQNRNGVNDNLQALLSTYGGNVVNINDKEITCGEYLRERDRVKNVKDACIPLDEQPKCKYYENDHVHLTAEGYSIIDKKIVSLLE